MDNVICMKWGTAYTAHDVNILHSMVRRHLTRPHRFVCFTDDAAGIATDIECFPLPDVRVPQHLQREAWFKLGTFVAPLADLHGTALFLDLDVVIVDNIDSFFEQAGEFCIIHNWTHPDRSIGNSSVYRFEIGAHADILARYNRDPEHAKANYRNEQVFLSRQLGADRLSYWPQQWCRSFKRHCLPPRLLAPFIAPRLPAQAKIIVFHGHPKPEAALRGEWQGRFRRMRKTPWIADYRY